MPIPAEIRSDFDRLSNLMRAAAALPDTASGEAGSMIYEYLCVAISGRLEQNIKTILIAFANNKSERSMGPVVSKLCQQFQNPDKDKILALLELFDKDSAVELRDLWKLEDSSGAAISDLVGIRKMIAHQTSNARSATRTKVERFYRAYVDVVTEVSNRFHP